MLYNLHFVTSSSNDPKMKLMGMSIVRHLAFIPKIMNKVDDI